MTPDIGLPEEQDANLPPIVDSRVHWTPDRLYGATMRMDRAGNLHGRKLIYKDISNAVNKCAHWLDAELPSVKEKTTVAYVGSAD